jgi:hypothetical protein
MGYVRERFCFQVSIFQAETLNPSRLKKLNKGKRKRGSSSPARPANTASQAVQSQQPNVEAYASQQPNTWATFTCQQAELSTVQTPIQQPGLSTRLPLSPRSPPITDTPGTHVSHSPLQSHIATAYEITEARDSVLTGSNQSRAENGVVHVTEIASKDLGCFHPQNLPSMNTISTNSQKKEQPPPALGASQSQQSPGKSFFFFFKLAK